MSNTQIFHHQFNSGNESQALMGLRSVSSSLTPEETASTVNFEAGRCTLNEHEVDKLGKWINRWNQPNSRCRLYVGGANATSRSNQLRRFGFLMSLLEQLGVPQRRIQADDEWLKPTRMGAVDNLPADVVWLQVRGFHATYAMPPKDFGQQHQ